MKSTKQLSVIFAILLLMLFLPLFQGVFKLFDFKSLYGFVETAQPVKLSYQTYHNFSYQDYIKQLAKEKFGFRKPMIRLYNQFVYTFFRKTTDHWLIKGINEEYYIVPYINDITGKDLVKDFGTIDSAKQAARENIIQTLILIDTLKKYDKELLIVLAPSKARIYPEFLPPDIQKEIIPFSLQDYYAELFQEAGINYIDFESYFKQWKKTSDYPLYTRYGTHWASHTLPFVADSILRKIEAVSHCRMPKICYEDSNINTRYSGPDMELEQQMNLLFPIRKPPMPQPVYTVQDTDNLHKLNLLVISDSYFNELQRCYLNVFNALDFWKYNNEIISNNPKRKGYVPFSDTYEVIIQADVIMVMFTSIFSYDYLFGFIGTAQQSFTERGEYKDEKAIQNNIERIKSNPEWLENVKKQARRDHVPLEQKIRENAEYVFFMDKQDAAN